MACGGVLSGLDQGGKASHKEKGRATRMTSLQGNRQIRLAQCVDKLDLGGTGTECACAEEAYAE